MLAQYWLKWRSNAHGSCLTLIDTSRGRRAVLTSEYSMFQNVPSVDTSREATSAEASSGSAVLVDAASVVLDSGMAGEISGIDGG
jgi:hypothetical protein